MRLHILFLVALCHLCIARPASAHPIPVSTIDIDLGANRIDGSLLIHTADLADELGIDEPQTLLDRGVLAGQYTRINDILAEQFHLRGADRAALPVLIERIAPVAGDDALLVAFAVAAAPPPVLEVQARLFPESPLHRTFVNIRQDGELEQQFLFAADSAPRRYYAGSAAGVLAVLADFVPLGAEHVWLGFDHLAFVVGLILLGGTLRRLALIVTAFTIGHSITLAMAVLDLVNLPAWVIEPGIALSIIVVGADNLLRGEERDLRTFFAALFGLVHGFGFAFVLRDMGLPQASLALSLLGFNLGVELAQLAVVIPLAFLLSRLRARAPRFANRFAVFGSLAVIAAGVYWFVDRVRNLTS